MPSGLNRTVVMIQGGELRTALGTELRAPLTGAVIVINVTLISLNIFGPSCFC